MGAMGAALWVRSGTVRTLQTVLDAGIVTAVVMIGADTTGLIAYNPCSVRQGVPIGIG